MAAPTLKVKGTISVLWGTKDGALIGDGADATKAPNGMILESLSVTPKDGEPTEIGDGDGATVIQAKLENGSDAKGTAVYDRTKILPVAGTSVNIVVPYDDGVNAGTVVKQYTFWHWSFTRSRKKESTIELFFTHRPEINV